MTTAIPTRLALTTVLLAGLATSGPPGRLHAIVQDDDPLWSGTISTTRTAHGTVAAGPDGSIEVTASETVSWRLHGDGSATYTATYEERQLWRANGRALPIVISGSGSGLGRAGAFLLDPDPLAGRLLGIRAGWVVTAAPDDAFAGTEDRTEFDRPILEMFTELGAALAPIAGQSPPGGVDLSGSILPVELSPGGVEVPVEAAQSTPTLSGSVRQPTALGLQFQVPGTETVTWSLTRVDPPVNPRVSIRGPRCGCLDPGQPEGTVFRFAAFAVPRGGEFSAFTITSEGQPPEVLLNEGGEEPRLEVRASRETGAITLDITYTRNGRVSRAEPLRMEFCLVEPPELPGRRRDLAFDDGGVLTVRATGRAWHNGQDVSGRLQWEAERMGRPTVLEATPFDAIGQDVTFRYRGLPDANADFGDKRLTARAREGQCDCARDTRIRAFFDPAARTHPGGDRTPNWLYYWRQTEAAPAEARPLLHYTSTVRDRDGRIVLAHWDGDVQRMFVGDLIVSPTGCRTAVDPVRHAPTGRDRAQGFDCFAETLRHELQHRADAIEWWGDAYGPAAAGMSVIWLDFDSDQVPNLVEDRLPGCSRFSQASCDARPFDDVSDAEVRAYYTGWAWPIGTADREDWSCGPLARQWRGGACR